MSKKRFYETQLNGKVFTYDEKLSFTPKPDRYTYSNIWDAYESPSKYKVEVWEYWCNWFYENRGYCWIESRNTFKFTITGQVIDKLTGELMGVHITDTNCICWSLTD